MLGNERITRLERDEMELDCVRSVGPSGKCCRIHCVRTGMELEDEIEMHGSVPSEKTETDLHALD